MVGYSHSPFVMKLVVPNNSVGLKRGWVQNGHTYINGVVKVFASDCGLFCSSSAVIISLWFHLLTNYTEQNLSLEANSCLPSREICPAFYMIGRSLPFSEETVTDPWPEPDDTAHTRLS
jgi:hypothetical protein